MKNEGYRDKQYDSNAARKMWCLFEGSFVRIRVYGRVQMMTLLAEDVLETDGM